MSSDREVNTENPLKVDLKLLQKIQKLDMYIILSICKYQDYELRFFSHKLLSLCKEEERRKRRKKNQPIETEIAEYRD